MILILIILIKLVLFQDIFSMKLL